MAYLFCSYQTFSCLHETPAQSGFLLHQIYGFPILPHQSRRQRMIRYSYI